MNANRARVIDIPPEIWSFVGIAALIIVIPGADMMLVANNTVGRGRRAGFRTVAGAGLGLGLHAGATVAGLSVIIATSAAASLWSSLLVPCS